MLRQAAAIDGIDDQPDVALRRAHRRLDHLDASVGRGVIEDDQLIDRVVLPEDARETLRQVALMIVVGNDDGDPAKCGVQALKQPEAIIGVVVAGGDLAAPGISRLAISGGDAQLFRQRRPDRAEVAERDKRAMLGNELLATRRIGKRDDGQASREGFEDDGRKGIFTGRQQEHIRRIVVVADVLALARNEELRRLLRLGRRRNPLRHVMRDMADPDEVDIRLRR